MGENRRKEGKRVEVWKKMRLKRGTERYRGKNKKGDLKIEKRGEGMEKG